jgi:hypothetical protein
MEVIDPAEQTTWPADIRTEVEELAAKCREQPENTPNTPSYELSLGHVDTNYKAEAAFRDVLDGRPVALFHATRLLPHEHDAIYRDGLVVLTRDHRSRRLDRVIEIYGYQLGVERLERLRHSGPLSWDSSQQSARLGTLWGVTPLRDSFEEGGSDLTIFLSHWGGESFYWAKEESPELDETICLLTERSAPAIVEVGVQANSLTHRKLWPVFVAQLDHWRTPYMGFCMQQSVPPERVIAILDPSSDRWPIAPQDA